MRNGFTLLELLVCVAIAAVLAAVAFPAFSSIRDSLQCRETAWTLASHMRGAWEMAVRTNAEHQVEFDLDEGLFRVTRRDSASGSSPAPFSQVVLPWVAVPRGVTIRGYSSCSKTGILKIQFNPDGTGNTHYVCIMDREGKRKYRTGVPHSRMARVVINPWNTEVGKWDQ